MSPKSGTSFKRVANRVYAAQAYIQMYVWADRVECERCGCTMPISEYIGYVITVCNACNMKERENKDVYMAVRIRDSFKCRCCGARGIDCHHLEFVCFGGRTTVENMVLLCKSCHTRLHSARKALTYNVQALHEYQDIMIKIGESNPDSPARDVTHSNTTEQALVDVTA